MRLTGSDGVRYVDLAWLRKDRDTVEIRGENVN
jgi:hypothetical protein